jgi:hypothetical protein
MLCKNVTYLALRPQALRDPNNIVIEFVQFQMLKTWKYCVTLLLPHSKENDKIIQYCQS